MSDATELLRKIGLHRRETRASLRRELGWDPKRFGWALETLKAQGAVSITRQGIVRTPRLSEPAERILAALPETGEFLSGEIIRQRLGLSPTAFEAGRKELKAEWLVRSRGGRGRGVLGRLIATESRTRERLELFAEVLRLEVGSRGSIAVREEAFYACYPPPHEGSYPSYGALVVGKKTTRASLEKLGLQVLGDKRAPSEIRQFADGMNSFALRRVGATTGELLATPSFRGLESDALDLATATRGTVIQRNRAGTIRVVTRRSIWIREGGTWRKKSPAEAFLEDVTQSLRLKNLESTTSAVARQLLALCLHVLSPNRVGATLVWFFDRATVPQSGTNRIAHLGWQHAQQPPPLDVRSDRHLPVMLHSLGQVDRAAVFNSTGQLVWLGVNLEPTAELSVAGGTRHNSAACFSVDHTDAVVFVVSADGPVTVFKDGAIVRTTRR